MCWVRRARAQLCAWSVAAVPGTRCNPLCLLPACRSGTTMLWTCAPTRTWSRRFWATSASPMAALCKWRPSCCATDVEVHNSGQSCLVRCSRDCAGTYGVPHLAVVCLLFPLLLQAGDLVCDEVPLWCVAGRAWQRMAWHATGRPCCDPGTTSRLKSTTTTFQPSRLVLTPSQQTPLCPNTARRLRGRPGGAEARRRGGHAGQPLPPHRPLQRD